MIAGAGMLALVRQTRGSPRISKKDKEMNANAHSDRFEMDDNLCRCMCK